MFVILLQLIVISFICYHHYCYLNSYFLYFSLLLIPLLKLLLLLLFLLLLLYQYYFFLLNLLFESFNLFLLFTSTYRVARDFFFKNQVQCKNNSRIFQVHFRAAIFPYTTKYDDRQVHLKLILLPLACSKIKFILCTYPITFLNVEFNEIPPKLLSQTFNKT